MASKAHIIHSAATGSKIARVRAWLKRHPEVFVGLVIGLVLSVILLFGTSAKHGIECLI
jgi:hypothetical protein